MVFGAFHQMVSWPSRQPGHPPVAPPHGDIGRQRQPGHRQIGLPGIGHVAGDVGQAHALAPMPLIGIDAGIEAAGEQLREAVAQIRHLIGRQHPLDDQKSVPAEIRHPIVIDMAKSGQIETGHMPVLFWKKSTHAA
ncbi:hypothetical protein ACFQ4K_04165 [Tistrella bauzanensis]